ncbi:MAG: alpha/beta hydrolase family protein, partial [Nocardioidaceae bacterium]|nr:alpha/beta hydrolase family protein [Nocardioidaceae bacterium]
QAVGDTGYRADSMSLALRGVAQRVDVHADELRSLATRRTALVDYRAELLSWIVALEEDAGKELSPADQLTFDADCRRIGGYVTTFNTDVGTWGTDLAAEEAAMIAAFERVQSLEGIEKKYGGVADPADAALAKRPGKGATPAAVAAWWQGLSPAQRLAIIAASPGSIGNLDGIPAADRDAANRNALTRDLADLDNTEDEGTLTGEEKTRKKNAEAARDGLANVTKSTDPLTGEPIVGQLYIYDPDAFGGDGRMAISAGDLDTADNVTVQVPGFGNDAGSIPGLSDRMVNLYEAARLDDPTATNASLIWLGYDSPDNLPFKDGFGADAAGVVTEDMARSGGDRLADTIDGLRSTRTDDPAHLTVIGHSYGSTVTGIGAHEHDLDVDDIVFVGSPGVGGDTNNASDLHIDPEHVWAGANSRDLVANLGNHGWFHLETLGGAGLGDDPTEDDFGAHRFTAESSTRNEHVNNFDDHGKYFDHDTESLSNITQIVNRDYDQVVHAGHLHDPWYAGPQDPERDRTPRTPDTDGQP